METIAAFAAKTHFSELLDRVERGEELTITRHGRVVARLVPPEKRDPEQVARAIDAWLNRSDRPTLGGLSIQELRDEGRR